MPKFIGSQLLLSWLVGAVLGFGALAAIGYSLEPGPGEPITAEEAGATLNFAFRTELGPSHTWQTANGSISHTWFVRRAFAEGISSDGFSTRYTEQVLKVGWPFTMVRGFVRVTGSSIEADGAYLLDSGAETGPVRFLPLLPVWPGVLFDGLLLGLVFFGLVRLKKGRNRT